MKLHLPHKLRAALLACFTFIATTIGSASADFVWIGGDDVTPDNWNTESNWELTDSTTYPTGGAGPATPDSVAWDKLIFNGKTGTTAGLEGWNLKMKLTGSSDITASSKKLQGGNCSFDIEEGSMLTLRLHDASLGAGSDGGAVAVDLGGTFNMVLCGDKGGDATTVNYGDLSTTSGIFNISSDTVGTPRTYNELVINASLTTNIVSSSTQLHTYTFATYTDDVTLTTFSSQIESANFLDAGDTVLTASEENVGKYSVVHDTEARTIKLYYVTGQIAAMTWNGGAEGTWSDGSDTWLSSSGAQTTYTGVPNVIFNTEGAVITVSGDISAHEVTIQKDTTLTLGESASLQMSALHIDEGATLTMGTLPTLAIHETTGSGDLALTLSGNAAAAGNSTVQLPGCEFGSVRLAGGVFATNMNGQVLSSDLGSADLIMADGTSYVIRNGVGGSATVTSGDIILEGYLTLQVYGSVSNTVLSNNILKSAEDADTSIRKTDGGKVTLTGQIEAGHLFVSGGTLSLGEGADVTVSQVRLSEQGSNGNKLTIEEGATLHVTGSNNNHTNSDSLMLAHWGQTGFLEINGGVLDAPGAMAFMGWTGTGTFSVNSGTAKLAGVSFWGQGNVFKGTFNLGTATEGDGVIELGSNGFHDFGDGAVLNLGNGTIRLTADSHIAYNKTAGAQGTLNLIGTAAGTTFDTNGHNMVICAQHNGEMLNGADDVMNVTGGGNLVKTGEGTLTFNGNVEAGSITVEQGTLQLNGITSITQVIVNDGTLSLGENGKLSLQTLDASGSSSVVTYTDVVSGSKANGYAGGIFTIVQSSDETQETMVEGLETAIIVGVEREVVKQDGRYVAIIESDSGVYFVNEGSLVYGADDNCLASESTTGIALNGGSLTLGQNLNEGVAVRAAQSAILTVNEGVTLSASSLTADDTLLLTGAGVITVDSPHSLPTNVSLKSDWTGMVEVSGVVFAGATNSSWDVFSDLVTANSRLGLSGCSGWLVPGGTVAGNLCLLEGDALRLTDGSSGRTQTFSGNISGEGDFVVDLASVNNVTYVFSGDVSEWSGAFEMRTREGGASRTFGLQFTGAGDIATDVKNGENYTLNVTVGGTGDRTMTGDIENSGTLNLTVQGGGSKVFEGDMALSSLTVAAGTSVTLSGTTTIGSLTSVGSTVTNMGALTISGTLPESIADNGANLEIAVGETTLTLTTGAESTDGNGYMGGGYGYVVKGTDGSTLTIAESLVTGSYKLGDDGKSLLYQVAANDQVYFINTSTDYTGADVALVTSGTIQVRDDADLRLTEGNVPSNVVVTTVGSGSVTLDRNATVTVADTPLSVEGASIGHLILAEGTRLEYTSSGQDGAMSRAGVVVVQDGATFAHRVNNKTIPAGVSFEICGSGIAGQDRGALILGEGTGNNNYAIAGTVTLTGDATIWTDRPGALNGEVVGNGYTLTKTGSGRLALNTATTGANKILDAALDVREGELYLNLSNVNINNAGAESRKIAGKVTLAAGTGVDIYDGYTEFAGGLKLSGETTLNAQWCKGMNISGLVEGDADAVLTLTRSGYETHISETLVLAADNSETFAGTFNVTGNWALRADNENALGNGTLNLSHESASLTNGVGVHNVNLAGLGGVDGATVTVEGGALLLSGSGEYEFAGTANVASVVKSGSGTQTLGSVADGVNITVSDGTLTVTDVVTAGDVTLDNGATLGASLTLGGTLSGMGIIDGALTSTADSVIALDLTGIGSNGDALISAANADVAAGRFNLNLDGLPELESGLYSLLQWEGISTEQFVCEGLGGSMELVVSNNVLRLQIGNPDLYWKGGTNGTWDGTETDWSTDSEASLADSAFAENAGTHFLGSSGETYTISVQGSRTTSAMLVEGGSWSFTATNNADRLTVGKGGISITDAALTLGGNISLESSGGVKMKGDSSFALTSGTSLTVAGVTLTGTTISVSNASTAVIFATDNSAFTLTGGTLANAEAGNKAINTALNGVALEQNASGTLTLGGSANTLSSLKAATGSVVVTGSASVDGTTLSGGATVTTAASGFAIGSASSTVTGGSVSTSSAAIGAALNNVALTTTGDTTISGTQTLSSLTNGGATTISGAVTVTGVGSVALKGGKDLTVNGSLTNDSLVITGSTITAATDGALSLWNGGNTEGLTITGGSVTDSNDKNGEGRTVNASLSGVDYTFNGSGPLTLNGTQNIGTLSAEDALVINGESTVAALEKSGTVTVNNGATLNLASTEQALTLDGNGTLNYTGTSLSLVGESAIGTLNVSAISLSEGAKLTAANATSLTSITLNGLLNGLSSDHLAFDITNGASTLSLNGLSLEMLKNATTYDENKTLHLGHVGDLADGNLSVVGAETADGSIYFEDTALQQKYIISSTDGSITVKRVSSGSDKAWISADGLWQNGDTNDFGDGVTPDDETAAFFTGQGYATVTVDGDKDVSAIIVNTEPGSTNTEYTFEGYAPDTKIKAKEVQVQDGSMIAGKDLTIETETLTVNETAALTVNAGGEIVVKEKATGAITNNGSLAIGDQSEISLSGKGDLTTSGTTTVTMEDDATVGTLTNTGDLTVNGDATAGTLGKLTLTKGTDQGGNVTVGKLELADGTDNTFDKLKADEVTNSGMLTLGDESNLETLSGGSVKAQGDVTIGEVLGVIDTLTVDDGVTATLNSDTTVTSLDNNGSLNLGDKKLTLTKETDKGGNVTAESLTLADGTDNKFGKLTVTGEVTNSGMLTLGDESNLETLSGGSVTAQGDVTIGEVVGGIGTLTVDRGATATLESDADVSKLSGAGSVALGDAKLKLGTTDDGSAVSLVAGTLDVTDAAADAAPKSLNLGEVTLDTIVFDSGNVGDEVLIHVGLIDKLAEGPITLEQDRTVHHDLLAAGEHKLIASDAGIDLANFVLSAATVSAYQAEGFVVELLSEKNAPAARSLFAARAAAGGDKLVLSVKADSERTWNTSESTVQDSLGNDVLDASGKAKELTLIGVNAYDSLKGIHRVNVDGDNTIDLTEATPKTEDGLVVENLSGDGEHTLSIVGDGNDIVTLKTDADMKPATDGAANIRLSDLDAKVDGDTTLNKLTLEKASLDTGDSTLSVSELSGDKGSELSGNLLVTDSWDYSGSYSGATQLTLAGKDESTVYSDGKLSLKGAGQSVTLKSRGGANVMNRVNLTDSSTLTLDETLQLKGASAVTNGTLIFNTTIADANAPVVLTEGATLDVSGTAIIINGAAKQGLSLDMSDSAMDRVVARVADGIEMDDATSVALQGDFFNRYYRNATLLESGEVTADIVTDYYGSKAEGLSNNGAAGVGLLEYAALVNTPQYAAETAPDQKKLLDALDGALASGRMQQVDELASAAAGSGAAVMGVAFAGDMDRQLRAIRNRTTTMGVDSGYVHEGLPTFNAWINAEGDYRTLDADGTLGGYTLNSWGGTVGVDADLTPSFTAGLAVTAMYGDLKADSAETRAEGDMDTYYVSLFARYARNAWVHTFVASVGRADLSMERTVTCGDAGSYTTEGDTTGISFGLLYEVGYVVALDEEGSACIQPVANITYKHTAVDGYNESGSDASLSVGSQTLDSLTLGLGARFQAAIGETVYNRTSILELRALAKVETGDRGSSATVGMLSVPGVSGTVKSAEAGAFGVELGAGVTVPLGQDAGSLFMDVSAELRGSYTNVNGTVGYRINF